MASDEAAAVYFVLAALPVPESVTDCGDPITLSKIFRLPVCAVVSIGLKVTNALQLWPGASVSHFDVTANTDGEAICISTLTAKPVFLLPAFLIVTLLGLLVVSTVTLFPNESELVLMISFSEIGVGVAVGVVVAVAVGEEVPVAVAVGVAAVAVAVGVAVGFAVGVAFEFGGRNAMPTTL